jgi:hypothetical protein
MPVSFDSKIFGAAETMRALRKIDPEMAKQLTRAMKKPGNVLAKQARTHVNSVGLSNWGTWRGGYEAARVRRKIQARVVTSKRKGAKGALLRVVNQDAAGAIWEMAGRKNDGTSPRGRAFIRNIRNKGGEANRLIYRAWDETDQGGVQQEVIAAVKEAEIIVQAHLSAVSAFTESLISRSQSGL